MLAVVKMPHTDLSIRGEYIPEDLLEELRIKYGVSNVMVSDDEWIDVRETDWYRKMQQDFTPSVMLRFCRQEEHWTQKTLAEKLGIDKHVVSEMERGVRPISLKMARALGKVFGYSYKNFLPED
ncbi:MAG: helix-turn-helix transcriptional regulator [Spirochaetales bacterium]|nr:helix-turn-helix transcriptional regulator [Spirochaetales bacterium]